MATANKAMKKNIEVPVNLQQSMAKATHHSFTPAQELPPEPQSPLEYALSTLKHELANLSSSTENLYSTLEPFLPCHLFEDKDEGGNSNSGQPALYSEHDSNLSSTVLELHKALNELTRLQQRLNFINT